MHPDTPDALQAVLAWLREEQYRFTTVTPATQARVLSRDPTRRAKSLRDVFGWSRAFAPALLPRPVIEVLRTAGLLQDAGDGLVRSAIRVSSIGEALFAHSAYPTGTADAVFFGPDTVRFVDLVAGELAREPLRRGARILDVGCGSGAGGVMAALASPGAALFLSDINPRALQFADANARHAGSKVELAQGDLFAPLQGTFDLIIANPPYLNDAAQRTYRHGGGRWGEALSLRIVREGQARLAPGGRLVLYTGVAMGEDGTDVLLAGLRAELQHSAGRWSYRELDPDVFGEELEEAAYADAERIAAVAFVYHQP
ncbi:MAG TPA: class I SAM-dependent methyltransferase [Ramlibacter sp.]|jgi:methylase of polypeptide subunit release factors|nr:class I SAM-dependent methyltransferase [Ramlibacter sp.]